MIVKDIENNVENTFSLVVNIQQHIARCKRARRTTKKMTKKKQAQNYGGKISKEMRYGNICLTLTSLAQLVALHIVRRIKLNVNITQQLFINAKITFQFYPLVVLFSIKTKSL